MSLSVKAVDRLFQRLNATYGTEFLNRYKGTPESDLKAVWAHELDGFENHLHALAWALENLPERAPNVIEFRNLARRAPTPELPRLPEPKADPERVAAELAKLAPVRAAVSEATDGREWARRIIGKFEAGQRINPTTLDFARDALGIDKPKKEDFEVF